MKEVAKRSGVSVATVSNVLNNVANKTTDATRQRVLKAVKELNYKMDMTARSLSIGKSYLIGIILPLVLDNSIQSSVLKANPFYSEIVSGIEYQARIDGYDILISSIKSVDHAIDLADKRMLDGIAILGNYDDEFWKKIKKVDIPIVLIDSYKYDTIGVCNVGIDDELGAYLATKHLTTLGHRKVAIATGKIGVGDVNYYRMLGFKKAIEEIGLTLENCPVIQGCVSFKGGIAVGHKLLRDYDVTAVFAIADILALGIIKIMNQFGRKIPEDISIVGFDDLSICSYTYPGLTTIKQDIYKKGIEVARLLINNIKEKNNIRNIILPVELMVRETTQTPKVIENC